MRRILAASGLFAAGLFALTATAQPPTGAGDKAKTPEKKAEKKAVDPTEAAIAAALANDADIRTAQAKVLLAEAELAKARQTVVQRVVMLQSAIKVQQQALRLVEQRLEIVKQQVDRGTGPVSDLLNAQSTHAKAQAELAKLETELKLLTGDGVRAAAGGKMAMGGTNCAACHQFAGGDRFALMDWLGAACPAAHLHPGAAAGQPNDIAARIDWLLMVEYTAGRSPVKGPVADTLRAALDKKVTLGPKGEKVTFDKALEVFKKQAGFDVPVRGAGELVRMPEIVSGGEELTVGAWLQLFQDYSGGVIYVREYGLLFTNTSAAPPDAVTLTAFWKQKPLEPKK